MKKPSSAKKALARSKPQVKPVSRFFLPISLFGILFVASLFTIYNLHFSDKIYPNTYVAGINVGFLTRAEAETKLESEARLPAKIAINHQGQTFEIDSQDIALAYNFTDSAASAFYHDRTGNILFDFAGRISALYKNRQLGLRLSVDETVLSQKMASIEDAATIAPVYPVVKIVGGEIVVEKGRAGTSVDKTLLRAQIGRMVAYSQSQESVPVTLPIKVIDPTISDEQAAVLKSRAEKLAGKKVDLSFEYQNFTVAGSELLSFLGPDGADLGNINKKINEIAVSVNREPQDAKFQFENGKVTEFAPSKEGVILDTTNLQQALLENLKLLEETDENAVSISVPVNKTEANIKTETVNNLGIKELIGRGSSRFTGSIPGRVHNVGLASSKFNGILVAPGQTLSFNNTVGDVSSLTGYKQAYIIQDGRTVLGDGGGVCQVSTTLFRAVLDAGLPIPERRAHSYRVSYYEQDSGPGLDATVFAPTTDFKFTNDTPGHILIQTHFDPKTYTLVFEFYGTSDGRVAETTKPVVSNVTPPPPDMYQDDPTLPAGVIKQVDFKAWGATASFSYSVKRNNQVVYQKNFISTYRPWQAVFLRGTGQTI